MDSSAYRYYGNKDGGPTGNGLWWRWDPTTREACWVNQDNEPMEVSGFVEERILLARPEWQMIPGGPAPRKVPAYLRVDEGL